MHSAMQSLSLLFRGNCNVINVTTLGGNYVITTNEIRKQKYLLRKTPTWGKKRADILAFRYRVSKYRYLYRQELIHLRKTGLTSCFIAAPAENLLKLSKL